MKIIIQIVLITLFTLPSKGQNTWFQKLSYNIGMAGFFDQLTGVKQIAIGKDGSLFILASFDAHYSQAICKLYPNSHDIEWSVPLGYNGNQIASWCDVIKPTADSGIILCHNTYFEVSPIYTIGSVKKYSKLGSLQWEHSFVGDYFVIGNANDVLESSTGNYFALIDDSMFTLDGSGNLIDSTAALNGIRFKEMDNGDLLILRQVNNLQRFDTTGAIHWSVSCQNAFDHDTTHVFVAASDSVIEKIDASTGSVVWSKNAGAGPISEIKVTHDGGCIASVGYKPSGIYAPGANAIAGYLIRLDAAGDTVWTRSYQLPVYGLSTFTIMPGGNILAGGCYLSGYIQGIYKDNSTFLCMMNSDGSYPLSQTDYFCPGDANNDNFLSFVDDGLEVMLALGQTGTPRDTSWDGHNLSLWCAKNDVAIDWNSSSAANHKFSDFDGNGIIDTNDVYNFSTCPDSVPVYYRNADFQSLQNAELICLIPVNDTILVGDTIEYYLVLGTDTNPVDSIYGFAVSYYMKSYAWPLVPYPYLNTTPLGQPGIDLYLFHDNLPTGFGEKFNTLICRTDFQNAYSLNDTLGIIKCVLWGVSGAVEPLISDFKAILADGTEIPFNISIGSVYIDTTYLSAGTNELNSLDVYPNPANHFITIKQESKSALKIVLFNSLGQNIKQVEASAEKILLDVSDLANGMYTAIIISNSSVKRFSVVIQH